jgi:hypothetical protein
LTDINGIIDNFEELLVAGKVVAGDKYTLTPEVRSCLYAAIDEGCACECIEPPYNVDNADVVPFEPDSEEDPEE